MPPCPEHHESRVVRAGWYGKPPHRRQRWLCRGSAEDGPHRFSEILPRQSTQGHYCIECSTKLESWEGQAGAREYLFSAREAGAALAAVAAGESYRRASRSARVAGRRSRDLQTGTSSRPRDADLDGQIVANWVDVLTPIVCAGELPEAWPERIAVDSVEFRINHGPNAGGSFHVFAAVGYEDERPKLWRMASFPRRSEACWTEFLRRSRRHAGVDRHRSGPGASGGDHELVHRTGPDAPFAAPLRTAPAARPHQWPRLARGRSRPSGHAGI